MEERIRKTSPYGSLKTWKLKRMIVKIGDDMRQEQFAMQLISQIDQIFRIENVNLYVHVYEIIATGPDSGIMECINDSMSIDAIKKKLPDGLTSLYDYFLYNYGMEESSCFKKARDAFCRSLAASSLICYVLNIKDRHNGNIMIDTEGHMVHIDFGFLFTSAPGKGLKMERAPFKLTQEYL